MKGTRGHRDRKSYGSSELFKKKRKEENAARPKQVFDPKTKTYSRETAW